MSQYSYFKLGLYHRCPLCNCLHDDGAFVLTQSGNTYYICFYCDEKYPGEKSRIKLEELEKLNEEE